MKEAGYLSYLGLFKARATFPRHEDPWAVDEMASFVDSWMACSELDGLDGKSVIPSFIDPIGVNQVLSDL